MERAGVTTDAIERQLQQADGGYADYERNSVRLLEQVALFGIDLPVFQPTISWSPWPILLYHFQVL